MNEKKSLNPATPILLKNSDSNECDKIECISASKSRIQNYCELCNFVCTKKCDWNTHINTQKHKKRTHVQIQEKQKYVCEKCNFFSTELTKFNKHLQTQKHKKREVETNLPEKNYCQYCSSFYKSKSGLWYHEQKCASKPQSECEHEIKNHPIKKDMTIDIENNENLKNHKNHTNEEIQQNLAMLMTPEIIVFLIQQNKSVQEMMLEQNKTIIEIVKNMGNITNNNNSHNTTNIQQNNKSFNLNVFLNETCKDAMNMSDFLNRLDVTTYDFEETGKNGYVQGMCRILENGLNQLEVHERPIHCTDAKRETIYIKDNDKWEKDDDQKTKLTSVIKQVGAKNIKMIPQWCKEHPGWNDVDSKENDRYLKYVFNSMCGGTDEEIKKNYGDISRHISKITVVDKKEAIEL